MTDRKKEDDKELPKEGKGKHKCNPAEALKHLFEHPNLPETVKNSLKNVDFNFEFDTVKVAKAIMKSVEPILSSELERRSQVVDAFDKLVSTQPETEDDIQLQFCLDSLKTLTFELPDLYEILQLKFKNLLIKCVLCNNITDGLRNEASLVCERIMEKTKYLEDDIDSNSNEKWLSVYFWMVKRALQDGSTRSDVKRVWAMHKLLNRYIVTDTSPVLDTLKATVVSPNFLHHKEGRQHIAHLLAFNKRLVIPFHLKIKEALPTLVEKSKTIACSYGEVFNMAWTYALPEVREVLEEEMFQRWMEIYLKLDRPHKLSQGVLGKTIFRILSYLHNSRRLLQLSSAITRLYEPILWRSLKSFHPLERCNAAELFLDVFPLEKPESNIVENSNFMDKQFSHVMALLKDESHLTRIVTIRGVIPVFQRRIQCLSNAHCREILSWLANELANDGSSYLVRVAVWELFTSLAASDDPSEFLTSLLPQMTNHFHDTSEQVRKAFSNMLINIDKNAHLGISFTDVVPRVHIIARLALEGEAVGKLLSKLLMKSIYSEGMDVIEFIKRLKRLITQCPKAALNLFRWSTNCLTVQDANFIILAILVYLRQFTKERLQNRPDGSGKSTFPPKEGDNKGDKTEESAESNVSEDQSQVNVENIENDPEIANNLENVPSLANKNLEKSPSASPVKKKRRKQTNPLMKLVSKKAEEERFDIDGPTAEVHAHLLGCVHTVWVVFSKQLESNATMISEINQVFSVCLQNYLRCYKGTPAWYAALSLASLVPLTKLSENTTASSSCLAELRKTDINTPISFTEALIYTLTAWNRGFEIIELAIDYIDPAFKLFQLNSSGLLFIREGKRRGRVVRFAKDSGKEMVGLRFLSLLFYDYHNIVRLLKHYDQVYELYTYLEGIKVIVEARFNGDLSEESCHVLTDTFIKECFSIMLDLIPVLDRPDPPPDESIAPFRSTQHMSNIIEWATRVLLPHLIDSEITPDNLENETESREGEEESDENLSNKKKKKKPAKVKKSAVKKDLVIACIKAILKETTFMVNTKMTDVGHIVSSANFALLLIKSEGKYWFLEDCLDLVEAISEHTRAWCPADEDKFLSVICPSVYSHIIFSLTVNAYLTRDLLQRYNCDIASIKWKLLIFPNTVLTIYGGSHDKFINIFITIIKSCVAAVQSEAIKNEAVEMVAKVEDLPLGVCLVTQAILSHPKLLPLILSAILEFTKNNLEDGILVVCCISYLYTILETNSSKFNRTEMVYTVQTLYEHVQTLSPSNSSKPSSPKQNDAASDEDSFFLEPLAKLDAHKTGVELLQKIADSISCQLVRPPSSVAPIRQGLPSRSSKCL